MTPPPRILAGFPLVLACLTLLLAACQEDSLTNSSLGHDPEAHEQAPAIVSPLFDASGTYEHAFVFQTDSLTNSSLGHGLEAHQKAPATVSPPFVQ